ncbi:competence protein ComEC [Pedobacter africanus]|uniref:Beta-lactamase superfamily II metal-dependent hydrolase n=1 Tax=Pedobacter africanus TaxID=151894 RepID=A0ACC6KZE6_9SPHI|nr:hypothetical protein [Pedobacter africanus]MDR6784532.1 beta-lactamase superfamily II metal-dependent hydrolase [Pedobacter africanus]
MADQYKAIGSLYADIYSTIEKGEKKQGKINRILMGSFVKLLPDETEKWQKVFAFDTEGWLQKKHLINQPGLKVFYADVGQGDGALIEVGGDQAGIKMLIDGGPGTNLFRYLRYYQYKFAYNNGQKTHFDLVFISHFDKDHYEGLIPILNDDNFSFGTIYHNGIAKFDSDKAKRPPEYNTTLGKKIKKDSKPYLVTTFNTLEDLNRLKDHGGMQELQQRFLNAVNTAKIEGRLQDFKRLDHKDTFPTREINGQPFAIDVLGPIPTRLSGELAFDFFPNPEGSDSESHTVNGHSLVLKLTYGTRTLLFGGDLNIPAEEHLLSHYGAENPFEVDVAKSCHHGASEFTIDFMAKVNPLATVISSGDNNTYAHPRADAVGCSGKYSRSKCPLVFSTELARSTDINTSTIRYGMINLRCDGTRMIMAQMLESIQGKNDVWNLYEWQLNP